MSGVKFTLIVTIGRGLDGGGRLSNAQWAGYKTGVALALKRHGAIAIQAPRLGASRHHADQRGLWEGKVEEAATFVCLWECDVADEAMLQHDLNNLRTTYGQEAIGFINVPGQDHLICEDSVTVH